MLCHIPHNIHTMIFALMSIGLDSLQLQGRRDMHTLDIEPFRRNRQLRSYCAYSGRAGLGLSGGTCLTLPVFSIARANLRTAAVFNASQHVNGEASNPGFEALAVMPLDKHWIRQVTGCCTKPIGRNCFSVVFGRALESHGEAVNI